MATTIEAREVRLERQEEACPTREEAVLSMVNNRDRHALWGQEANRCKVDPDRVHPRLAEEADKEDHVEAKVDSLLNIRTTRETFLNKEWAQQVPGREWAVRRRQFRPNRESPCLDKSR